MLLRNRRSSTRVLVLVVGLALLAAACGGGDDDNDSVSTGGSTATTAAGGGADGNDVLDVQRELTALSCDPGPLDGTLGPDTVAGIRQFQRAAGITVDGIVGPVTRSALSQAAATGAPTCVGLPPEPKPAPPPSPSTPPCTDDAIRAGVTASLLPGEQLAKVNMFYCAITWAITTPTLTNGNQISVLLRWNGTAWQAVDQGVYCDNGSVPAAIYQRACQSN